MRTGAAALEVKGVTVRFGGLTALNKVDITVPNGSVVAVIGPNGSGKSTLFNVITGLVEADEGSIRFHGEEMIGLPPHTILAKGIARTFQKSAAVHQPDGDGQRADRPARAAEDRRVAGDPAAAVDAGGGKGAREWALEIFSIFGNRLTPRVEQMVAGLSYANRRRIEIARALASRPRILLLDEPTAGMNPAETLELAEQIKSLNDLGLTVLLIEHKLDVVTRLGGYGVCAGPWRRDRLGHAGRGAEE